MGVLKKFGQSLDTPTAPHSRSPFDPIGGTRPNLQSVALPVPEIIWVLKKEVPGNAHAPFSPKFLMGFCSDGPYEGTCQIWCL